MVIDTGSILRFITWLLLFPTLFQGTMLEFVWGTDDNVLMMIAKRLFLLLPALAFIAGCWITVPNILTILFRHKRREFINALFLTWWDLGKSIVSFWGGIFKFVFVFFAAIVGLIRMVILSIWSIFVQLFVMPFRAVRNAGQNVVNSKVPWIAVFLTIFWCLIEALIFTYVTTPLVSDTLSNITGDNVSAGIISIPLYIFLLFVVLGSYAVLSNFVTAMKSKNVGGIIGISVVELVVLFVEVVFLYREFVDSLVPWFAQYSPGFELGIVWTLVIACVDFGSFGQERRQCINAAFLRGQVQRGYTALCSRIHLRAFFKQKRDYVGSAMFNGKVQRRQAGVIGEIEVARIRSQVLGDRNGVAGFRKLMNRTVSASRGWDAPVGLDQYCR